MNIDGKLIGLLFYTDEKLDNKVVCEFLKIDSIKLDKIVKGLNTKISELGLKIIKDNKNIELVCDEKYSGEIEKFFSLAPQALSQASLEVLSIIAYKQPITKPEIDEIRGVSSEQSIRNLINKDLICEEGSKSLPKYKTTLEFLKVTGINNIKELPKNEKDQNQ